MKRILILLVFISGVFFAQTEKDTELTKKVNKMKQNMIHAVMNNDQEALMMLYSDEAVSMPSYQPMLKGKAKIKTMVEKQSKTKWDKMDLTTDKILTSGNYVIEIGTYDIRMKSKSMPDYMDDEGKYVNVYEMQDDGSLQIIVETWNTDKNPWMSGMKDKMDHKNMDHN